MKQAKLFESGKDPEIYSQLSLEEAKALTLHMEKLVKPFCNRLEVVGSIRRRKPTIGDLDFIIISSDWSNILRVLKKFQVICSGNSVVRINYPYKEGLFQVDFYRATPQTWGIQSLIRTGSADHNVWLASYALSKGFKLRYSEGLLKDKAVVAGATEESIFTELNLLRPDPKLREIVHGKPIWLQTTDKPT